jgi:hypothetical protein
VIVPFLNWELEPLSGQDSILWCPTAETPFSYLPFVPVNYGKSLANTFFSRDYFVEMLHSFVDNMNLSYVAFTRAIDELHVFASPGEKMNTIGDLLFKAINNPVSQTVEIPYMKDATIKHIPEVSFEYGSPKPLSASVVQKDALAEVFNIYPVADFPKKVRLKYRSDDFFSGGADDEAGIDYGIIMHSILANVKYPQDLEKAVNAALLEGRIDTSKQKEIFFLLSEKLASPPVKNLFSHEWQVFAEREILTVGGEEYRPDRVMIQGEKAMVIDYKFGGHENPAYAYQLKKYMKLLKEIGYEDVEAYIWYIMIDKCVEVKNES